MWCQLPQRCLARQTAQWVPIPAPTRQPAGGTAQVVVSCLHRRCKENASLHTLCSLCMMAWLLEGSPSVARKPARSPCFWEVLNQNLPVHALLAPLFSSACEMPLNSPIFSLYWLTLKTSQRICTPSASFSWGEAVDGSMQHLMFSFQLSCGLQSQSHNSKFLKHQTNSRTFSKESIRKRP